MTAHNADPEPVDPQVVAVCDLLQALTDCDDGDLAACVGFTMWGATSAATMEAHEVGRVFRCLAELLRQENASRAALQHAVSRAFASEDRVPEAYWSGPTSLPDEPDDADDADDRFDPLLDEESPDCPPGCGCPEHRTMPRFPSDDDE